jgi:hypothetical protein
MNTPNSHDRTRRKAQISLEPLEGRELMTGGAGNTFAITPGTIKTAGGSSSVTFTIDPAHFTLPHGTMMLGIDVVAQSNATLKPDIVSVQTSSGKPVRVSHAIYDHSVQRTNAANGKLTSAVIVPISFPRDNGNKPVTYTVNVTGLQKTSGQYLLGFYLPGDPAGTGTVNQAGYTATRKLLRLNGNDSKYNFYADANRDGKISPTDLSLTRQNMGVTVNVSPVVTSNLNPASVTQVGSRVTTNQVVNFTGNASPGATITYTNVTNNNTAVTATTDSKGNYSVNIQLVPGTNSMTLATHDPFGQSISGAIDSVTYLVPPTKTTT